MIMLGGHSLHINKQTNIAYCYIFIIKFDLASQSVQPSVDLEILFINIFFLSDQPQPLADSIIKFDRAHPNFSPCVNKIPFLVVVSYLNLIIILTLLSSDMW